MYSYYENKWLHAELNSKSQHSNYWLNDTDSLTL